MNEAYRLTYASVRGTERAQAIERIFSGAQVSAITRDAAIAEFIKTHSMMQLISQSGDDGIVYGVLTLIALHTATVVAQDVIASECP